MLESMRKHAQGWLAKVVLGTIILSFALWGIGDYFTGNQIETIAEIDGEVIHDVEFAETYNRQLNNYKNMMGEQFSKELVAQLGVKDQTMQTMINRRLMLMEAKALGLVVPDLAVLGTVQSNPAFQEAKGFSTTRYQTLVRQMGFASPRDYENYLRQSMLIDTLQQGISNSAVVSDAEVQASYNAKFEKRVLAALIVSPAALQAAVEVNDEQARAWFESHDTLYQSPLKVELQAVEIDAAKIMRDLTVSDEDVQQAYAERQSEFGSPEKRRVAQILVSVAQDATGEVLAQAEEKIKAAKQRLNAGESFAAVAKEVSTDAASAANGGDLGLVEQGALLPEMNDVVFGQLNAGDVSDVIRTQLGLHLVKVTAVQQAEVKALAEVKDMLSKQLLKKAASDEAYRLSQDLDNALGMEDSLEAAAKTVNLPVQKLGQLSTENVLASPLLSSAKELQSKVFKMMPGDAIEIVEISDGHYVALQVMQRINPQTMSYEEVVKRVYNDVRADAAEKQAQKIADEILAAGLAGADVDQLAQKFAQPKYISKPVLSSGEGDESAWLQSVLAPAFRTPEGNWVNTTLATGQGIAVVYVKNIEPADQAAFKAEAENVRSETLKAKGAVRFARWMASVRDRHEISINNRVLARF